MTTPSQPVLPYSPPTFPRRDIAMLFLTRSLRLFAYGALAVMLVLYLSELHLSKPQIGRLVAFTLAGDIVVSLFLTTHADRLGRRRTLVAGAALMLLAGVVFAFTANPILLLIAATVGVISPSGGDVGPFLAVEQAALSHVISAAGRTGAFAWYNLAGSLATALGSLVGGALVGLLLHANWPPLTAYRAVVLLYAAVGLILALLFTQLSPAVEIEPSATPRPTLLGLHQSRGIVLKLSMLFALDAFAGGFVIQSFLADFFHIRFSADPARLGAIFFGGNVLAGLSALAAARVAKRFGLINTMVFTHLPSNVLLMLVPLMPNLAMAVLVLMLRFSISQMDVPTRQAYTMAVVSPDERSAASGVAAVARSVGASLSPLLAGYLLSRSSLMAGLFYIGGSLKIVYDLLLYRSFVQARPAETPAR